MIRVEPDKVRFHDSEAAANEYLIHTIELSDERSLQQFITLWFKGKETELPQVEEWKRERGLNCKHQREIYHRGDPWLPAAYPGKESRGWSHHEHIDLTHAPRAGDLDRYRDGISPALFGEVSEYLRTGPGDVGG